MFTANEFIARRHELPDGGRWTELIRGETRMMEPPDQKHGDVIHNLAQRVAGIMAPDRPHFAGFEIGVQTTHQPDTVRFPAVSVFTRGDRFAQLDSMLAAEAPTLVMEIVSSSDRRRTIAERVFEYHRSGVEKVWVIDPIDQQVTILKKSARPVMFSQEERLTDIAVLPGLEIAARELFVVPSWWNG